MDRSARARSPGDRALRQAQALLALDPQTPEGARRLVRRRSEVLALLDLLAAQDHVEEACELGLLLEQALEQVGEPSGLDGLGASPGQPEPPPESRFWLIKHLLGIARSANHSFYEGEMLLRQAELWAEQGDAERAQALYGQVQLLAQGEALGLLAVAALAGLATLAQREGNLFKAHLLYGKQRAQAEALGEVLFASQALANLSATALAMGDFRRGARYARERLQLCSELGDEQGQAEALCGLGLALRSLGDPAGSRRSYLEALRLARQLGSEALEATVCYNFGCLLSEQEPELAAALLEQARRLARRRRMEPLLASSQQAAAALEGRAPAAALSAARRQAAQRVQSLLT